MRKTTKFYNKGKGANQFDVTFMRVCSNKQTDLFLLEDDKEMKDVIVDVYYQDEKRIVTLLFQDCEDENYLHLKESILNAKEQDILDYESKYNSYIFHLEFDTEKEISCGGDVNASKSRCFVDEGNNSIVFID